ncbi:MAG TPA: DUF5610 domain-containing protein [Pseudomonas sp.]|uniref:DUF5610 domain-containing protein n=1 Tax=Pseudomonas sp. TaxID=306 RepID=UPI002C937749|nr:DUF5610 domain-containing protein [Pseudomonas sp.]HRL93363.1 DUF5610 domain-containing protein [Pseudomonas sp.]
MTTLASLSPGAARAPLSSTQSTARGSVDAQQTLANRLAERLGLQPGALAGKASDYSPEKVAERVLGFIDQRLRSEAASGADSAQLQKVLSQARDGVEQGFAEARKILDGLGVLGGQVAANIDDTYQRIQDGFAGLDQAYATPPATTTTGGSTAVAAYSERFAAQAQTFELNITTRDGDKLRIAVAQASASYSQTSVAAASNGSGSAVQINQQSSSLQMAGFQVSIEGELDDEERAALDKLFGQVAELSDKFYAGDIGGAFDQAMKLQLDGEQLASMSLQLTQTRVRQATDAYSAVAEEGGQAASAVNASLIDYAQGLLEALRSSAEASDNGRGTLEQMLHGVFSLDERFDAKRLDKADSFNQSLLDGLQNLVSPSVYSPASAE